MITNTERLKRTKMVNQALAIVRLEGQNPGPRALSVYDEFIEDKFGFDECKQKLFQAAADDLKEQSKKLDKEFPSD